MTPIHTTLKRIAGQMQIPMVALMAASLGVTAGMAQDGATMMAQHHQAATGDAANTLIRVVHDATEQYKDVHAAMAAGYALNFGCVTGEDDGAMGLHYVNGDLVNKGVLDPRRPQIIIYEPIPGGGQKLIGADFLVLADQWNATHKDPPQLMGQLFHLFPAPNRFGLPPFYTLHVWAWKDNPKGAFVNWHPNVSCRSYPSQQ